jgi:hypothetical protein
LSYCQQERRDYAGLFTSDPAEEDLDPIIGETEEEKKIRLEEERKELENEYEKSWTLFIYSLAEGSFLNVEKVLKSNYRLALWYKSVEKLNKKTTQYYDWGKYNIEQFSNQK